MGMQMPNASSGDINGTMAQIPGYGNAQSFGPFQNFIPQLGQNLYAGALGGGSMPAPVGGYWNQVAQQMAGPMFGPYGASTLMGTPNPTPAAQPSPLLHPASPPSSGTPTSLGYIPTTLPTGAAPGAPSAGSGLGALGSFGDTTQPFGQAIMNNPLLAQKLGMMSRLPIMRY